MSFSAPARHWMRCNGPRPSARHKRMRVSCAPRRPETGLDAILELEVMVLMRACIVAVLWCRGGGDRAGAMELEASGRS